ncbi:MAG: FAD-binding oxidoreductase [Bacteroidota bacterium]|nr:FAD-binding oxidoreductase [Bacteroidota bacterium]
MQNNVNASGNTETPYKTAKNCRHYAMCKIDFLGSGVCTSGLEKQFVSYYPQGRMILYEALAENKISVTKKCVEIANSCNLCGKCDLQCYFINEMRPTKVMEALKNHVETFIKNGGKIKPPKDDNLLAEIRKIVGDNWATNDEAITVTYSHDVSPISEPKIPDYVVMPNTKEEIASLVKLFNKNNIPYTMRGNGQNLLGFAVHEGVIMDLNRMKTIEFDEKNWLVKVGPGVSAFDLQKQAQKKGFRINAGEPAALICANIMCSGIMSTFSTTYGINADNFIDAEFIDKDGAFFNLNDASSPNLYAYQNLQHKNSPGICVSASIRLHPMTEDESGILVPFQTLDRALGFIKDCAIRHIGLALGIVGAEYISAFLSPTKAMASDIKDIFIHKLDIPYLVVVIGDRFAIRTIDEMGFPYFDQRLFNALYLGLPSLKSAQWLNLVKELSDDEPYSYLRIKSFADLLETALSPSPALYSQEIDPELRPFFERLFLLEEITDLVWLNMYRIMSTRLGRKKPFLPVLIYLPIDPVLINDLKDKFRLIAEKHQIDNDMGFITPIDHGKRCIFEYDYFFDYNDPDEIKRIRLAATEANRLVDEYSIKTGTVKGHPYVLYQGFCRKENLLYS